MWYQHNWAEYDFFYKIRYTHQIFENKNGHMYTMYFTGPKLPDKTLRMFSNLTLGREANGSSWAPYNF